MRTARSADRAAVPGAASARGGGIRHDPSLFSFVERRTYMTGPEMAKELGAQEPELRRKVNEVLDLTRLKRDILNVVLDWSLLCGREWAEFESFEHLAALAGSWRPHVSP